MPRSKSKPQNQPQDAPEPREPACLDFTVRRAARVLGARHNAALEAHGLTIAQYSLLSVLAQAGLRSLTELGRRTSTDRTTLNRNLGLLERRGLVESSQGVDRRTRRFRLTTAGRRLRRAASADWLDLRTDLEEVLGRERMGRLLTGLEELVELLGER